MTYLLIILVVGIAVTVILNRRHKEVTKVNWELIKDIKDNRKKLLNDSAAPTIENPPALSIDEHSTKEERDEFARITHQNLIQDVQKDKYKHNSKLLDKDYDY